MNNFFITSVKSLKQTGTVSPSSKFLIKKIVRAIDFQRNRTILEFGTGNGCITEAILANMSDKAVLHSFELNDHFFQLSRKKFKHAPNIKVHNENALDFEQVIGLHQHETVDCVVSSLPLTLLKNEDIHLLIKRVKKRLKPGGYFIQYQYSLDKLRYFKKQFKQVSVSYTLRNIPPAFVYSCSV